MLVVYVCTCESFKSIVRVASECKQNLLCLVRFSFKMIGKNFYASIVVDATSKSPVYASGSFFISFSLCEASS